jgi:hypothetical protein
MAWLVPDAGLETTSDSPSVFIGLEMVLHVWLGPAVSASSQSWAFHEIPWIEEAPFTARGTFFSQGLLPISFLSKERVSPCTCHLSPC